jgi:hypothetical protein
VVVVWDKRVNEHIYIHLLGKRGSEGVLGRNTLWLSKGMTAQEQSVMCWSALILHGCNCPSVSQKFCQGHSCQLL